ncbi:MAG TPA: pilus assembly protein TadG-related protein [Pirellulaceae bacterium]|nr:pilus assembly protein TadG-related protein [Pirellulaceae bacterium]
MNKRPKNYRSFRSLKNQRTGTILVITAIVLLALVGLLGLVIDAGLLMTAHRQAQNAADAGATAAAMDMLTGKSDATAIATAATFVQEHNALADATVTANIPPGSGAHLGEVNFVEVIVDFPVRTRFIQVLGVASLRTVSARSVAGWEPARVAAGVIALDPNARPGINLTGNGDLKVNGGVIVNSNGGGLDEFGQPIGNGNSGNAITTAGNGVLYASDVQSVGGVNAPSMIKNYDTGNSESPLHTGSLAQPDPYQYLPPPTTATGAVATDYGEVKLSGNSDVTLSPGVYSSITVSSNVNVTLSPGIYIIAGGGITMTGNSTLTGSNVMIYNTGSDYNVNTGLPDSGDGSSAPPASGSATFGSISITGNAELNLTPYSNASSPFDGMVFYQRRLNPQPLKLGGNGTSDVFSGTLYAKWAPLDLSGNGTFNAQFVVKSVELSGNGTLTLDITNQNSAKSDLVYLVE